MLNFSEFQFHVDDVQTTHLFPNLVVLWFSCNILRDYTRLFEIPYIVLVYTVGHACLWEWIGDDLPVSDIQILPFFINTLPKYQRRPRSRPVSVPANVIVIKGNGMDNAAEKFVSNRRVTLENAL